MKNKRKIVREVLKEFYKIDEGEYPKFLKRLEIDGISSSLDYWVCRAISLAIDKATASFRRMLDKLIKKYTTLDCGKSDCKYCEPYRMFVKELKELRSKLEEK